MPIDDEQEASHFDDSANREAAGASHKPPSRQRLSSHVPIRFDPLTASKVKLIADGDGKSVSAWIRDLVGKEVRLRMPSGAETLAFRRVTVVLPVSTRELGGCTVGESAIEDKDLALNTWPIV